MFNFTFPFEFEGKKYAARCEDFRLLSRKIHCHIQDKELLQQVGHRPLELDWNPAAKTIEPPAHGHEHAPILLALREGIHSFMQEKTV